MATFFAEQRPSRGAAGFRFRTRTKSKYDKPVQKTLIEQMEQELNKKRGKSATETSKRTSVSCCANRKQRPLNFSCLVAPQVAITKEDVKKFFQHLSENTHDTQRSKSRLPLQEAIDFKIDMLRARVATQNFNEALEALTEQRLNSLLSEVVEEKQEIKTGQVQLQDKGRTLRRQTAKLSVGPDSILHASRSRLNTSSALSNAKLIARESDSQSSSATPLSQHISRPLIPNGESQRARQKLRLSAEGLLDIVTEQFLEANIGSKRESLTKQRFSRDGVTSHRQSDAKGQTILTPILTEESEFGNANQDSSPGTKYRKDDQMMREQADAPISEGFSLQVNQMLQGKKSGVEQPVSTSSLLDKTSQRESRQRLKPGSSMDKLQQSRSSKNLEVRGENNDLEVVSSQTVRPAEATLEADNADPSQKPRGARVDRKIKQGQFRRRLMSAGANRPSRLAKTASFLHSATLAVKAQSSQKALRGEPKNAAYSSKRDVLEKTKPEEKAKVQGLGSDDSWAKNLSCIAKADDCVPKQADAFLSLRNNERSAQTIKQGCPSRHNLILTEPVNNQTESSKLKPSHPRLSSPPSVDELPFQRDTSSNQKLANTEAATKRAKLEELLVEELTKLQHAVRRGTTPELAFIDRSQLIARGLNQSPEKVLKFFEETMKQHFKYGLTEGGSLTLGRPILSTRQNFQSQIQQKVLEAKVLETLKSQNQKEQYDEFVNAQQVAAAMMDIVSSTQSGDIVINPKELTKEKFKLTLKIEGEAFLGGTERNSLYTDAMTFEPFSNTGKSLQHKQQKQSFKNDGTLQVDVARDVAIHRVNQDLLGPETVRSSLKQSLNMAKLDLAEQENVSRNIEFNNQKLAASRKQMIARREARQDSLNVLSSPKNEFQFSSNLQMGKEQVLSPPKQGNFSLQRLSTQDDAKMNRVNSDDTVGRKRTMQTQGGGFNRTQNSGYFKSKKEMLERQKSEVISCRTKVQQTLLNAPSSKQVFVEERAQILPNEVWSCQARGMPYKVVLQVQKPRSGQNDQWAQGSPGKLRALESTDGAEKVLGVRICRGEARFEVFTPSLRKEHTVNQGQVNQFDNENNRATANITPVPQEVVVKLPSGDLQQSHDVCSILNPPMTQQHELEKVPSLDGVSELLKPYRLQAYFRCLNNPGKNTRLEPGAQLRGSFTVMDNGRKENSLIESMRISDQMVLMNESLGLTMYNRDQLASASSRELFSQNRPSQIVNSNQVVRLKLSDENLLTIVPDEISNPSVHKGLLNNRQSSEVQDINGLNADYLSPQADRSGLMQVQNERRDDQPSRLSSGVPKQESQFKNVSQEKSERDQEAPGQTIESNQANIVSPHGQESVDMKGQRKSEPIIEAQSSGPKLGENRNRRRSVLQKATPKPTSEQATVQTLPEEGATQVGNGQKDIERQRPPQNVVNRFQLTPSIALTTNQVLVADSHESQTNRQTCQTQQVPIMLKEQSKKIALRVQNPTQTSLIEHHASGTELLSSGNVDTSFTNRVNELRAVLPPSQNEKVSRPRSTVPNSTPSVVGNAKAKLEGCATQSRQIIFRKSQATGTINNTNSQKSWHTRRKAQNNADISTMITEGRTQLQSNAQEPKRKSLPQFPKQDFVRMTFSQGVTQLIKNFDKKFILDHVMLPQKPLHDYVQAHQMEIVNRSHRRKGTTDTASQTFINSGCDLNLNSTCTQSAIQTLTNVESSHLGSPKGVCLFIPVDLAGQKPRQMVRSKSRPPAAPRLAQKSPIQQKTFDARGLSQVSSQMVASPLNPTTLVTLETSPNSVAARRQRKKMHRGSLKSQTTLATQNYIKTSKASSPVSKDLAKDKKVGRLQKGRHPLEFLAKEAIETASNDLVASRNNGLIINDRRQFIEETDFAMSHETQNVVAQLNSSMFTNDAKLPNHKRNHVVVDSELQSEIRGSLLNVNRNQRHQRQFHLFSAGSQNPSGVPAARPSEFELAHAAFLDLPQVEQCAGGATQQATIQDDYQIGGEKLPHQASTHRPASNIPFSKHRSFRIASGNNKLRSDQDNQTGSNHLACGPIMLKQPSASSLAARTRRPPLDHKAGDHRRVDVDKATLNFTRTVQSRIRAASIGNRNRLSLTQSDIDEMFKSMRKQVQIQTGSRVAVVQGTQVKHEAWQPQAGPAASKKQRRAQSSSLVLHQQHRAGDSMTKRQSLLFNQAAF